ncbi:hypothetical protein GOV07_03450 [Candidatus Woesearchaeota archaeon]|nr:hypothetical protein [Candidatus Woesearchaeota archaeon]
MNLEQWRDLTPQQRFGIPIFEAYTHLTFSNIEIEGEPHYDPQKPTLFISNHDCIIREAILLNYIRRQHGLDKATLMVGENLFGNRIKSFLVNFERVKSVPRGQGMGIDLAALTKDELDAGFAAWLSHSRGRSKDGHHITASPLLANLTDERVYGSLEQLFDSINIQPYIVSTEYEPTAPYLAGKKSNEILGKDGQAIASGLFGWKGQAKVVFRPPLEPTTSHKELESTLNNEIQANYPLFQTHEDAEEERSQVPHKKWKTEPVVLDNFSGHFRRQIRKLTEKQRIAFVNYHTTPVVEQAAALEKLKKAS